MSVANKFFAVSRPKVSSGGSSGSGKPEINYDITEFLNGDLLFITKEELYRLKDIERKYKAAMYREELRRKE